MDLTKEAVKYLMEQGISPEKRVIKIDESGDRLAVVNALGEAVEIEPVAYTAKESLVINTLSGFVNYVKANIDRTDKKLIIHIKDQRTVYLKGLLETDGSRETLATAKAIVPDFSFNYFMDSEEFVINFQSKFIANKDREILLKVMGNVVEENVKNTGDDGITQAVSIRQGVASRSDVKVPNPVLLQPYRTFLEVEQPESQFIFRMKDGPRGAIFEADGGAWVNQAITNIREYLKDQLNDEKTRSRITIIA